MLFEILIYFLLWLDGHPKNEVDTIMMVIIFVLPVFAVIYTIRKVWEAHERFIGKAILRVSIGASEADLRMRAMMSEDGMKVRSEGPEILPRASSASRTYWITREGHPLLVEMLEYRDHLDVFIGPKTDEDDGWFDEFVKELDGAFDSGEKDSRS